MRAVVSIRPKKPRTVDARWCAIHLPRSPEPTRPARAPLILQRPTSPPVRDHANSIHRPQQARSARSSPLDAPGTTGLTHNQRTTPYNHGKRPKLPRDAQFSPATGFGAKTPTLEAAMLLQNARTSCRRPTPPQMPPPSPRADSTGRISGNISASRCTRLAPAIAPRKPHALQYLSRPCYLSPCSQCYALPPAPGC